MNFKFGVFFSGALLLVATQVFATTYTLPSSDESLIGERQIDTVGFNDTVVGVAQKYDLGLNAVTSANPQVDVNKELPFRDKIVIPTQHLLPNEERKGIVINLPEMRMYYYPTNSDQVYTFPIGIGKIGKTIPIVVTSIKKKKENPDWIPPEDIREYNLARGIVLPKVMPAGPDNPLGPYAIYMRLPTYLIHSTIFPESIGTRASFGCIRMYESDIKTFFPSVDQGVPVVIVNAPVKTGWEADKLYMESHAPLEEHGTDYEASLPGAIHMVYAETKNKPTLVDWQMVTYITQERDGVPHEVGEKLVG